LTVSFHPNSCFFIQNKIKYKVILLKAKECKLKKIAVFPGSFDPITNGHIDIIERCNQLFDKIIIAIAFNPEKRGLFTLKERLEMIRTIYGGHENIIIDSFEGLLMDYARRVGAGIIIRGLRAISDFEYEFQMALMNRRLDDKIETIFMMPHEKYSYVSSRLIKEVFQLGGSIQGLVPPIVEKNLREKFAKKIKN